MPKPNTKAIIVDAVTERRTKRYSPTFWAQRSLLWANFHIPVSRQRGRELSPPRPCVRDPFHPLSFIHSYYEFLYIYLYIYVSMLIKITKNLRNTFLEPREVSYAKKGPKKHL